MLFETQIGKNREHLNYIIYVFYGTHKNIQFSYDYESQNSINFLDLTITRKKPRKLTLSIYRKTTTTDVNIHASSCHPYTQVSSI